MPDDETQKKPNVLITGAAGNIGQRLTKLLSDDYHVLGLDLPNRSDDENLFGCDITDPASVEAAVGKIAETTGGQLASVIHLAAYFDFTGEEKPQYQAVNVDGTRNLLKALRQVEVEQFVYSGTMLVHAPGQPGERIDESAPIDPQWAYPQSKAQTEDVIREHAAEDMKTVFLHLAGLYDEQTAVPTLSHQIARIYERSFKSHAFSGDMNAGQAFIHRDDMLDLFRRVIARRADLDRGEVILAGEPDAMGYGKLQDRIGQLIHGQEQWETLVLPAGMARMGAAMQTRAEPAIPDALDQGEKPFIRPFMIDMASDHYALDISKARRLLDWAPEHDIEDVLPRLIETLKDDPVGWYNANGITPPPWLEAADARTDDPEALRARHEANYRARHRDTLWGGWVNAGLGIWMMTSGPLLGYGGGLAVSNLLSGALLLVLGLLSISWRLAWARFAAAGVACWILFAPLVFWTDSGAGYLNATLVGMLAFACALCLPPAPGVSPVAAETGPEIPRGWSYSPSDWFQRLPVIALALVGLLVSRYLTAYQLGSIDSVWEPFFSGTLSDRNGTEQIITSDVSTSWPVPDAGVGAMTYALEILVGIMGTAARWRTMPWLVVLFGIMIVPLGAISIFFIVIQPIVIGTYSTLALIAAFAMVWQIPYSLDELVATYQFLRRRHAAGQPWMRVFFTGDTDEYGEDLPREDFERAPKTILADMLTGGLTFSWNLLASMAVGVVLMLSPIWLGLGSPTAATNHVIGALAITVSVAALAPVARLARFLNLLMGIVLLFAPLVSGSTTAGLILSIACGLALIGLSFRRGPVHSSYGRWDRLVR
ncbi:NAD-dependent epimerase/dehydratase family protein [Chachezhania antarctica]|uniref:NAD-dependent epimerase/dehydratase family protein n=1 Tax=Chachezhania antarctica TaxID=2340860 RepID=UPI000EAF020F|nr:NAD-dependent epimerase/dehydratase family protein [Chachezhania antarctica]|tara:strand:- start:824 stop:3298 length:2475 start_codon:yes stop_codon:yes gene_type:complete